MDLVVGAGSHWLVPIAGFRGSNRLLAHFFLPRRFEITFFEKVLMEKNCERKRHPNGGIGWVGGARLRISGEILGLLNYPAAPRGV
jgi:hypothetical protein